MSHRASCRFTWLLVGVLALAATAAVAEDVRRTPHLGVQAGLLGIGVAAGMDVSDGFALRAQLNRFDYAYERDEAGNDYVGDLSLSSAAFLADWHAAGSFRFTLGAVLNNNELAVEASSAALDLGDVSYNADLRVRMDFDTLAPYAGIGWSTRRAHSGLGINVDLGVLLQGAPTVQVDGVARGPGGQQCGLSISPDSSATLSGSPCLDAFPTLEEDAEREHAEIADALESFEAYPVLSVGLVYRF